MLRPLLDRKTYDFDLKKYWDDLQILYQLAVVGFRLVGQLQEALQENEKLRLQNHFLDAENNHLWLLLVELDKELANNSNDDDWSI